MHTLLHFLILLPRQIAAYLQWLGPLVARIVVGYTFMLTGWAKLSNLDFVIKNFTEWGIPFPHFTTPFVASWECFGGLAILLGLMTRISAGALAVVMVVAILSAKLADVDSLETLLGFEEASYFAIFTWLAVYGAGRVSLDYYLENKQRFTFK
jgi:putative oxidoreductase